MPITMSLIPAAFMSRLSKILKAKTKTEKKDHPNVSQGILVCASPGGSSVARSGGGGGSGSGGGWFQRRCGMTTGPHQRPGSAAYLVLGVFVLLATLNSVGRPSAMPRQFSETARPDKCNNCFPYTYTNILAPVAVSASAALRGSSSALQAATGAFCARNTTIELVMLITTTPGERRARDAIRATWCNTSAMGLPTVRCVFLFGTGFSRVSQSALRREATVHGDILQEDFLDDYYNLSIKVLMGYRWVMRACPQARHVVRTAADNFVNVPQVLELVRAKSGQLDNFMLGDCHAHKGVWRWPVPHKWVVTYKEYPYFFYPPYCIGTTFVTSFNVMSEIVRISVDVPFFPIEDVYFGMCLQQYNNRYKLAFVTGFNTPLVSWSDMLALGEPEPCGFPAPWYSIHDVTPADIRRIARDCQTMRVHKVKSLSTSPDEDLRLNDIYSVTF